MADIIISLKTKIWGYCIPIFLGSMPTISSSQLSETLRQELAKLRYSEEDISHFVINSNYEDVSTGITHYYLTAKWNDINIVPDMLSLHFSKDNQLLYYSGALPKQISEFLRPKHFGITAESALQNIIAQKQITSTMIRSEVAQSEHLRLYDHYLLVSFPDDEIQVRKIIFNNGKECKPAFECIWKRSFEQEWLQIYVDANDGTWISENNLLLSCDFTNIQYYRSSRFEVLSRSLDMQQNVNCYHVFPLPVESPSHGNRNLVFSPWNQAPNASPYGWHGDGFNQYNVTKGNNVDAYEDSDNDDLPTGGDAARANGGPNRNFDFPLQPLLPPLSNKNAAITNVFYWSNIMHDIWYQYGFNEVAGNFQYNNSNKGGFGNDFVEAQAIDNLNFGRNNANFGTGPDGVPGLMQMYAWKLPVYDTMVIEHPSGLGKMIYVSAAIGGRILQPLQNSIVLTNDGSGFPNCGCNNYINGGSVTGKIALVDRGVCSFSTKITKAMNAGAACIMICHNEVYDPYVIGGLSNNITIPVVMISKSDCERIKLQLWQGVQVTMMPSSALKLNINGSNVVFSRAAYGASIPNGTGNFEFTQDAVGDVHDACQPLINGAELQGKIAIINDNGCDVSYKIYQAQQKGAALALLCKMSGGYADSIPFGPYSYSIAIPVIKVSQETGNYIKNNLPLQGTFSNTTPQLTDGDFDGGIICHEYGHGISNRLTGGPNNIYCLLNAEQMGEGWSDYFGLVLTMLSSDNAYKSRGLGTYNSGQTPQGVGVRPYPYNVSLSVNPADYSMLPDPYNISAPHGIGYIWCSMLWDLNWAMINKYGFESNWYNSTSGKGNIKAARLIMEGLKLQACSPGFVDGRNAILKADTLLYNGVNTCMIWNVFARRGLGYSANQGNSNNRYDGTAAYNVPPNCLLLSEFELFQNQILAEYDLRLMAEGVQDHIDIKAQWDKNFIPESIHVWRKEEKGNKVELPLYHVPIQSSGFETVDNDVRLREDYYYQLQLKDATDKVYTTPWVRASLQQTKSKWRVFPNPVSDEMYCESEIPLEGYLEMRLTDTKLSSIEEFNTYVRQGDKIKIQVSNLLPGVYYLHCTFEGKSEILRFTKL